MQTLISDNQIPGAGKHEIVINVPNNWSVRRFRDMFLFSKGLNITKENLEEEGIPCVNYGEIHSKYGFEIDPEKHTLKCVRRKYIKENPKSLLNRGDIVFADTSEDIEGAGNFTQLTSDSTTFAGYHTVVARPIYDINHRFLAYVLDSNTYRNQIRRAVKGVKVFSITKAILKSTKIWFPELAEQDAIVNLLDKRTAQIDEAIAIKEKQIALLKERKQIIIQKAVTQGLDPDVKMKDSGVDWIGQIPGHWGIKALKFIAFLQSGETLSPDNFTDEGYPVYGGNGFRGYTSKYTNDGEHPLIGRQGALCGNVNYAKGKFYASEHAIVAYPLNGENAFWLGETIKASNLNRFSQSAAQPGIAVSVIKDVHYPYPPITEQNQIAAALVSLDTKTKVAIEKLEFQIERLKEYKATLINSAVTGKIKVA